MALKYLISMTLLTTQMIFYSVSVVNFEQVNVSWGELSLQLRQLKNLG